jgi:hypothetical protein
LLLLLTISLSPSSRVGPLVLTAANLLQSGGSCKV